MFKKIAIFLIDLYQVLIVGFLNQILGTNKMCRFEISCSNYTKMEIEKKGILKGLVLGFRRLLMCHPFAKIEK